MFKQFYSPKGLTLGQSLYARVKANPEIVPVLGILGAAMTGAGLMVARQSYFNSGVALFDKSKSLQVPEAQDFNSSGLFHRFENARETYFPGTKTYK
jgi:hypothetical protein